MSVELYFVRPDADGRVPFPCWDTEGVACADYYVVQSLKWAMGAPCFHDADFGPWDQPIAPTKLASGARTALRALMAEIAVLHDDLRARVEDAGDDLDAVNALVCECQNGTVWAGGDAGVRQQVENLTREQFAGLYALLLDMLRAAQDGYYGCWSF